MNGAERIVALMGRMMKQVRDTADIVYGTVTDTWPLRILVGDITIDENFIIADTEVLVTLVRGEDVRMLRTNGGQKFYILKIVDASADVGMSVYVWVPDISSNGTITWTRTQAQSAPNPVIVKGPQGNRGARGTTGDPGPDGYKGPDGDRGPRGNPGLPGEPGIDGENGDKGPDGDKGPTGDKGLTGAQGPAGEQGPGIPAGGAEGQRLVKYSGANYVYTWLDYTFSDMLKVVYNAEAEILAAGGFVQWVDGKVPFIADIKNNWYNDPEPTLSDGDILLTYAPPELQITAAEYDTLDLTADEYAEYDLTATEHDTSAKSLLT